MPTDPGDCEHVQDPAAGARPHDAHLRQNISWRHLVITAVMVGTVIIEDFLELQVCLFTLAGFFISYRFLRPSHFLPDTWNDAGFSILLPELIHSSPRYTGKLEKMGRESSRPARDPAKKLSPTHSFPKQRGKLDLLPVPIHCLHPECPRLRQENNLVITGILRAKEFGMAEL